MAGWSRMTRASIVIVGMAVAIPLFWLGRPGLAVVVGLVALAIFWLTLPAEPPDSEPTELDDEPDELFVRVDDVRPGLTDQ